MRFRAIALALLFALSAGTVAGTRKEASTSFDVLVFGDPQPQTAVDVGYYRRDIVEPLVGRTKAKLGITLGDIADDMPSLYPAVRKVDAELGVPWLYVPGNHDIDAGAKDDAASLHGFHRAFGADTFLRRTGMANFIVMDDVVVMPGGNPAYIGGFRPEQFAFLEKTLPTLAKDKLLVVAVHIPLFEDAGRDSFRDADRERLFELLRPFPHVLLLSGHSHGQRNVFHGESDGWHGAQPLHEYNVGATCGAYWSGVMDASGIPAATMADGTPNGYAVLTIEPGGGYALAWHSARDAADPQMGLHAPKVLRQGAYPAWGVYANVYMGDDDTRVEYRIDGGEWKPMRKVLQPDPALLVENARDDEADALRGYDRSPEAEPSPHLWRGALPTNLAIGEHEIEVREFDRWRGEQRARIAYRLESAQP
ncbi:MAG: calcineurin-like phosphoesterase C-terminal domain-containing protein [Thermomonas sp.]